MRQYSVRLGRFREEFGDDFPLDEFTAAEARQYLQAPKPPKGEPWAPTTQEAVRVCLGALWSMVMEEEAEALAQRNVHPSVRTNPWTGLEMPEIRPTRTAFLSPEEWVELDRTMVGRARAGLSWGLAFLAGLRQGEIRHLRTHVDVLLVGDEPIVRVQSRGGDRPWRPKTKRGERDVPVTPLLAEILADHIERGYAGDRYLIPDPGQDRPIVPNTAMRWTADAFEAAGIRYGRDGDALTLHSGRHTFASWLAQDGVPLNVVADLIGDTLSIASEVYSHLVPNTYRAAVANIERRARRVTQ